MTNKQTIDGMSRELAERVEDLLACPQHHVRAEYVTAYTELRALLDAPAGPTKQEAWALQVEKELGIERLPAAQPQGEVERLQLIEQAGQHVEDHLSKQLDIAEITIQGLRAKLAERDALLREIANKCNVGFAMRERLLAVLSTSAEPKPRGEAIDNPVIGYADSYRAMARQGVETVSIWSVITDLERNIAPLFTEQPSHSGDANEMVAKVVLPERKTASDFGCMRKADGERAADFYNSALDDVAKLNGLKP